MTELPPPARPGDESSPYPAARKSYYDADQMLAYAEEAIKQEREAILAALDDLDERPWYGYENPNTFDDGKRDAMAVVRARSSASDALEK